MGLKIKGGGGERNLNDSHSLSLIVFVCFDWHYV